MPKRALGLTDLSNDLLTRILEFTCSHLGEMGRYLLVQKLWQKCLQRCKGPSERGIDTVYIIDSSVSSISSQFADLQQLDLSYCNNITDTGVQSLSVLTGLQRLELSCCENITDTGVQSLSVLTGLQQLNLRRTGITDTGVQSLSVLGRAVVVCAHRSAAAGLEWL